ncbi:MAG: hypothetical protein K6G57_09615 [Lachnospiraceae bacterium]|nr:hypothetical protein [Lachnospiraceae bacterium]
MSVNGITTSSQVSGTRSYKASEKPVKTTEAATAGTDDVAAVYEPSQAVTKSATYTPNTALVSQLKSDAEQRAANLQSLVEKVMKQQATTYGNATDIWSFLREGNFTVDPQTKAEAQAAIAEDGYWGVNQTSDRIVQFATALTGGDPDKIDEMMNAFKKGFQMATKTWGGELPEISQKTYDAVIEKFNKLKEEA